MANDLKDDIAVTEAQPDMHAEAPALENDEPTEAMPADDNTAEDLPESEDDVTTANTDAAEPAPEPEEAPEIPDPAAEALPESTEPPPVFLNRDVHNEPADEELSQEDAYRQLQDYMTDRNYGRDDYDTYSQDPQWQELHQKAFPEHYTDSQAADNVRADAAQDLRSSENTGDTPAPDTEQSGNAEALTGENPEFSQQHEDPAHYPADAAGKRPGKA